MYLFVRTREYSFLRAWSIIAYRLFYLLKFKYITNLYRFMRIPGLVNVELIVFTIC